MRMITSRSNTARFGLFRNHAISRTVARSAQCICISIPPCPPCSIGEAEAHLCFCLALTARHFADAVELLSHALIGGNNIVESICQSACETVLVAWQSDRKIPVSMAWRASKSNWGSNMLGLRSVSRRLGVGPGSFAWAVRDTLQNIRL